MTLTTKEFVLKKLDLMTMVVNLPIIQSSIYAQLAQLVEQRTENPCVGGSIPPLGTILSQKIFIICLFDFFSFLNQ